MWTREEGVHKTKKFCGHHISMVPDAVTMQRDEAPLRDGENLSSGDALEGVGLFGKRDRHVFEVRFLLAARLENQLQAIGGLLARPEGILDVLPAVVGLGQHRQVVGVHEELQVGQAPVAAEDGVVGHLVSRLPDGKI